jgi:hypothetical protein
VKDERFHVAYIPTVGDEGKLRYLLMLIRKKQGAL